MKKTAIVTGGAGGIGFGTAQQLAADGFNIAIFDIKDQSTASENIAQLNEAGSDTMYYRGNIANVSDCYSFVEKVIGKYRKIDVLVNNSGVAPKVRADMLETTEESIDYVFGVNIKGTFFMTQAVARRMIEQNDGIIVNISSISAYTASVNRGEYCLSKAGIAMLTQLLAAELAADGIGVYEVRPGIIATDMTAGVQEKYNTAIAGGLLPIPRWGTPEDIGEAVSLLCSGRLRYSTGDVLNVDGGFHLRRL